MPADKQVLETVRGLLKGIEGIYETKKLFQPHNFYIHGHFCCGVEGKNLLIAIDPEQFEHFRSYPYIQTIEVMHKPLKDVVWLPAKGKDAPASLKEWVDIAVAASRNRTRDTHSSC